MAPSLMKAVTLFPLFACLLVESVSALQRNRQGQRQVLSANTGFDLPDSLVEEGASTCKVLFGIDIKGFACGGANTLPWGFKKTKTWQECLAKAKSTLGGKNWSFNSSNGKCYVKGPNDSCKTKRTGYVSGSVSDNADDCPPTGGSGGDKPSGGGGEEPVSGGGQEPVSGGGEEPVSGGGEEPVSGGGEKPHDVVPASHVSQDTELQTELDTWCTKNHPPAKFARRNSDEKWHCYDVKQLGAETGVFCVDSCGQAATCAASPTTEFVGGDVTSDVAAEIELLKESLCRK